MGFIFLLRESILDGYGELIAANLRRCPQRRVTAASTTNRELRSGDATSACYPENGLNEVSAKGAENRLKSTVVKHYLFFSESASQAGR